MKRLLLLVLSLLCVLALTACPAEDNANSSSSDTETSAVIEDKTPKSVKKAKELINEGKIDEAYAVLYADRSNEAAKNMLSDFKIFHTKTQQRAYADYWVIEEIYNQQGDVVEYIVESSQNIYDYTTKSTYEYDEKGNKISQKSWDVESPDKVKETKFTYDDLGRLIKEDGTTVKTKAYDEFGNIIKETETVEGYCDETVYKYDKNNNVIYIKHSYSSVDGDSGIYSIHEKTYNENNQLVKDFLDNQSLKYQEETEYEYNDHGDISQTTKTTIRESNKTPYTHVTNFEYTYDSQDRIIKTVTNNYLAEGSTKIETFTFDDRGDLVREETYSSLVSVSGTSANEYDYTYNENGVLEKKVRRSYSYTDSTLTETYDEKGNPTYQESADRYKKYTYTYDEKNNIIKSVLDFDDKITTTEFTYDEKGNVIKKAVEGGDTIEYIYDYSVGEKGKVTKETTTNQYGDIYIIETKYDSYGNEIYYMTHDMVSDKKEETTYTYVYNEKGIWIEKSTFEDGKLFNKIKREINKFGTPDVRYLYDADDKLISTHYYKYDKDGNLLERKTDSDAQAVVGTTYEASTYDELGRKVTNVSHSYGVIYEQTYSDFICFYLPALS